MVLRVSAVRSALASRDPPPHTLRYFGDVDLCLALRSAGHDVLVQPDALAFSTKPSYPPPLFQQPGAGLGVGLGVDVGSGSELGSGLGVTSARAGVVDGADCNVARSLVVLLCVNIWWWWW